MPATGIGRALTTNGAMALRGKVGTCKGAADTVTGARDRPRFAGSCADVCGRLADKARAGVVSTAEDEPANPSAYRTSEAAGRTGEAAASPFGTDASDEVPATGSSCGFGADIGAGRTIGLRTVARGPVSAGAANPAIRSNSSATRLAEAAGRSGTVIAIAIVATPASARTTPRFAFRPLFRSSTREPEPTCLLPEANGVCMHSPGPKAPPLSPSGPQHGCLRRDHKALFPGHASRGGKSFARTSPHP